MKSMWQEQSRREVGARLAKLSPDTPAKWGRMSAPQMVAHLSDAIRMALGELPTKRRNLPIRHTPLKQLIIYVLPFPKGAPTAPELKGRTPLAWNEEVQSCTSLLERFGALGPDRTWPEHPAFGTLTAKQWGILAYRHTDHHLRQFGV